MGTKKDKSLDADQLLDLLNIGAENDAAPSDPISEIIPSIRDYELVEKLGEAGQGQVWKAIHLSTRKEIALKIPKFHGFSTRQAFQRFEREVEVISHLDHPNIVKIYDSGIHKGIYFYTMDFVKGKHLDDYCRLNSLSQKLIIKLVKKICDVIEFAHNNNVIHRDLKPSNILITEDGEPHILDFGLAKLIRGNEFDPVITIDSASMGTPAYMSPEQAKGQYDKVDTRSDIYSLGTILFFLLTNELPFDISGNREEVIKRVSENRIKQLKKVKGIDRELKIIFYHIFQTSPEERYSSAGELAADLQNYLDNKPLISDSDKIWYKTYKYVKKFKYHSAAMLTLLALAGSYLYTLNYLNKLRINEDFNYSQGTVLSQTDNWELLRTTTPPINHIVINQQITEGTTFASQSSVVPNGITINILEKIQLCEKENFEISMDFSFNGNWLENLGLVFNCKDKNNFYAAEIETNKSKHDRLIFVKLLNDEYSEISFEKFDLNMTHNFQLQVFYDYHKNIYSLTLMDTTDDMIIKTMEIEQANDFSTGKFGIITCDAFNTFIQNVKVSKYPEPVEFHKTLSTLFPD